MYLNESLFSKFIADKEASVAVASIPEVGSSSSMSSQPAARALASMTRCFCPPESLLSICPARLSMPTSSSARRASLRKPVDAFFENVMVNAEDKEVRLNRLTLLSKLRELFLQVADISLLQ